MPFDDEMKRLLPLISFPHLIPSHHGYRPVAHLPAGCSLLVKHLGYLFCPVGLNNRYSTIMIAEVSKRLLARVAWRRTKSKMLWYGFASHKIIADRLASTIATLKNDHLTLQNPHHTH